MPVGEAVGLISAEAIAGYPPGIPALLPGERITAEVIDHLRELTRVGVRLHGASDPELRTIETVIEDELPPQAAGGGERLGGARRVSADARLASRGCPPSGSPTSAA